MNVCSSPPAPEKELIIDNPKPYTVQICVCIFLILYWKQRHKNICLHFK